MNKYSKIIHGMFAVVFTLILASCAKPSAPANYDAAEVGKIKKVSAGTIVSMRPINVRVKEDGSNVDETNPSRSHGYEYVIKLTSGSIISIAQTEDVLLKTKQRVLIIYGTSTRIVPDDGSEDL